MTACAAGISSGKLDLSAVIPPWPKAGPAVAAELDRVCPIVKMPDGTEVSSCPAIDEWHDRLDKFRLQLDIARKTGAKQ